MKTLLCFVGLMFAAVAAHAAVQGKEVSYEADGVKLKGYIAYDDVVKGKRPGVLVVHEWWGLNDYARKRARMLAKQGYTALALDMYGNGKMAHHPDDAQKFSSEVSQNEALAKARFEAALALLRQQKSVDADNIGAIGYCFGGSVVLNMARIGEPLKVVESFHGGLKTMHPAEPGVVKARIASFTGEADPFIPAEQVAAFRQEMEKAGVTPLVVTYPGAMHSFTSPEADRLGKKFKLPMAYNAAADKDSWSKGMALMAEAFKTK
ncbi:dienelactone hydrolase family protein [Sideroxydans lithotrophicus]|uniref:Dienelactone hydrolase n=1 Tax=Sideroxydans lithotrophicus (strain ES-1) TaxID=580332 RepID=D5CSF3_SIDLE|nr:dienelactone hydrolase family protein [Sideroxydans lithotrophicus]ADE11889.1 dienelactone hydrolase [Sideroxydans lithotrophicus ES-1]